VTTHSDEFPTGGKGFCTCMEEQDLRFKVIVITGASSGLGRGTALELARKGAHLVLAARREEALEKLARECSDRGTKTFAVPTDVTKVEEVEKLMLAALEHFGRVDIWINVAGVGLMGRFEEIPLDDHFKTISTDLTGVLTCSYFAMKQFRKEGRGILINVASLLGKVPAPLCASYVAAKHGVVGLSAALREELVMYKLGKAIHVCTLLPPAMNTPFFEHCANYLGREHVPIPPVYEPERVVEKLIHLCTHPEDEATVGVRGHMAKFAHQFAPGLMEAIAIKRTKEAVLEHGNAVAGPTERNLHATDPNGTYVEGE
jgi:short-subunit dehydrogenase